MTNEYKQFSQAAQESDFDRDERKLIANEPGLLLEGASADFRAEITPQMLESFFSSLQGDKKIVVKDLINLGSFLYTYRDDDRALTNMGDSRSDKDFNEADKKIVNLGCRLIENAFYGNQLTSTDSKRDAALAFIINILAKILEKNNQMDLAGFNKKKFTDFISNVSDYEQSTLFGKYYPDEEKHSKDDAIKNVEELIKNQLASLKENRKTLDWTAYINDLTTNFKNALEVIEAVGYHTYGFQEVMQKITKFWPRFINDIAIFIDEVDRNAKDGKYNYSVPVSNIVNMYSSKSSLVEWLATGLKGGSRERSDVIDVINNLKNSFQSLKRSILARPPEDTKKFNDLASFAASQNIKQLPEVLATLSEIFENDGRGDFNKYFKRAKAMQGLIKDRDLMIKQDKELVNSRNWTLEKIDNPSAVPYFFKSCLIANNMDFDEIRKIKLLEENRDKLSKSHLFYGQFEDFESEMTGPRHANLHFIHNEMPLAVWAAEYLKSQRNKKL